MPAPVGHENGAARKSKRAASRAERAASKKGNDDSELVWYDVDDHVCGSCIIPAVVFGGGYKLKHTLIQEGKYRNETYNTSDRRAYTDFDYRRGLFWGPDHGQVRIQ